MMNANEEVFLDYEDKVTSSRKERDVTPADRQLSTALLRMAIEPLRIARAAVRIWPRLAGLSQRTLGLIVADAWASLELAAFFLSAREAIQRLGMSDHERRAWDVPVDFRITCKRCGRLCERVAVEKKCAVGLRCEGIHLSCPTCSPRFEFCVRLSALRTPGAAV